MATSSTRRIEAQLAASWDALRKALLAPRRTERRASTAPGGFIPLRVRAASSEVAAVVRVGTVSVTLRVLDAAAAEWVARLARELEVGR